MAKHKQTTSAGAATVSLGKIVIDAPPDQVYRKLARAREWEGWLKVAHLIHTAQPEALETDNTFCYLGDLAPGFIDAIVHDAEPNKAMNWSEKALFGLVRGRSHWQLKRHGGGAQTMWLRRPKTVVVLDQEVTGPFSFMVSTKRLDSQTSRWLGELKEACEKGGLHTRKQ